MIQRIHGSSLKHNCELKRVRNSVPSFSPITCFPIPCSFTSFCVSSFLSSFSLSSIKLVTVCTSKREQRKTIKYENEAFKLIQACMAVKYLVDGIPHSSQFVFVLSEAKLGSST